MKKLFVILLLFPLFFSCNQEEPGTKITGMIDNLEAGLFVLGGPGGTRDTVLLNEDNSFEYDFADLEKPGNYYVMSEKDFYSMYIAPGMQLDLYIDKDNFMESLSFAGVGSDINNYKVEKARNFERPNSDVYTKDPDAYRAYSDSLLALKQSLLNEQIKDDGNDPFWVQEEGDILYTWAQDLGNYPAYYKYYAKVESVELPESYNSYMDQLDINDSRYSTSSAFKNYVKIVIKEEAAKIADPEKHKNLSLLNLQVAKDMITNKDVFKDYLTSTVIGRMQWKAISELQEEIDFFFDNCSDEEKIAEFNKEYEAWKKLAEGEQGFDFVGHDLDGNVVKFSDFKGKYLYVDVWATWCGPCVYEIPFLKELEADYHDRNIVFMSYSIDSDKDAWLKYVPENELGGVQIIGEDAWQSAMLVYYKVRGVPTFMLFGPEGEIISVKMTRPSDQKTRDKFDSYKDL
ncbi:MAG: TlpA family protein disulfide reductase [Bacteroidales bacterium]|nr:TlpA family protein disulfide reductase [Bacteroidales bacterium]